MNRKRSAGFTIVELLIATLVFTIVLLICLESVSRIGRMYYKGITEANAQQVVRGLSNEFTQQIQFGPEVPSGTLPTTGRPGGGIQRFCIGDYMYKVTMNRTLGDDGVSSVLKRAKFDTALSTCPTTDVAFDNQFNIDTKSSELAAPGMRVLKLSVGHPDATNPYLWAVSIRIAVGDYDLIDYGGSPDDPTNYEKAKCRSQDSGTQFCSVNELNSTIVRRIH